MNESRAKEIAEQTLELSDADAVAVTIIGDFQSVTRFADNAITQNVQRTNISLGVSCAYGKSHGSAVTNQFDGESLKNLVERAQTTAKSSSPDPEYMPPLAADETQKYPKVKSYFEQTLRLDPAAKAEQLSAVIATIKTGNFKLSGAYSSGATFQAIANSAGLYAWHRATAAEIHTTAIAPAGSGWAQKVSNNADDINIRAVIEEAFQIAADSQNPVGLEPGKYTVVMLPAAVAALLTLMLRSGLDAKATDEGRTFLRGRLATKVCGNNVTIRSDPSDPRCPANPFQLDGLAAPALPWIKNGVVENLAYSRFWAKKQGRAATGTPSNIIMDGGNATVARMIATIERGILVTRCWYTRWVDPMIPLITGMTRDGLFLIENGRVSTPIKHMRFNVRLLDLLSRVEEMSRPERSGQDVLVPALQTRDFNFTATTRF